MIFPSHENDISCPFNLELTDSEFRLEEGWRELFERVFKAYVEHGEKV
jgi:hypothetical protein